MIEANLFCALAFFFYGYVGACYSVYYAFDVPRVWRRNFGGNHE